MGTRLAIFDLDGTLADTRFDIARSLIRVLEAHGLSAPPEPDVIAAIGWGAPRLVQTALGPDRQHLVETVGAAFRADYRANLVVETEVYDGIPDLLARLAEAGTSLAVATNKPGELTRGLLDRLGLLERFDVVAAPEDVARPKPAPDMLLWVLERTGVPATEAVMVGDMETDLASARAAGLRSVLVTYSGFFRPPDLVGRADRAAATVAELGDLLLSTDP